MKQGTGQQRHSVADLGCPPCKERTVRTNPTGN